MRYHRTGGKDISVDARNMRPFLNQGSGDTYQVKVSDDDTTPGYLSGKITSADTSVAIAVANDATDEDLDLSVSVYVAAEITDHAGDPDAHHDQVHVLATNAGLGADHTMSGATAGHVLRASSATAAAFAQLQHSDLGGVTANQHHNQSHVLASTSGLGADHTVSGLTAGQVLRATSSTAAAFASLQATDLPSHVLATNTALGSQHSISGATAGHVLRASGATAAAFAQLQHSDLGGVGANDHHNQSHVLATTSALGADHTVSGLTSGQVLRATGATTAAFGSLQATDLPSHVLATNTALGSQHTISGATAGHVLRASSATAANFQALAHSDLGGVGANDHHNQSHVLASASGLGADHTVSGLTARQVLVATGATTALFRAVEAADLPTGATLSVSSSNSGNSHAITTSSAVSSATAVILATDASGRVQVEGLGIGATAGATDAITMGDDAWIGLGASAARIVFDNQTVDQIEVRAALVILNSDTPDSAIGDTNMQSIDGSIGVSYSGNNAAMRLYAYGTGVNAGVQARTARGTRASPTASQADDTLARYGGGGYGTAFSTENTAYMQVHASQNWTAANNGSDLRFYTTPDNSTTAVERGRIANDGTFFINETANGYMAIGLTINQGAGDGEIIALKSSDVAHGVTDSAETDTFGLIKKLSATDGGASVRGYTEATRGIEILGIGTTGDTTKTSSSAAYAEISAVKKSGTGLAVAGANENIMAVRTGGVTKFIIDAEGDSHRDGTDNTYDTYHDAHLARAFDLAVSPGSVIDSEFDAMLQYGRDDLIAAGILHESGFYNESRLLRLAIGGLWQEYTERQRLTRRVQELEQRLLNA